MKKILQQLLFAGPLRLKAGILLFLICWASLQTAGARSIGAPSMIYERSLGADPQQQIGEVDDDLPLDGNSRQAPPSGTAMSDRKPCANLT